MGDTMATGWRRGWWLAVMMVVGVTGAAMPPSGLAGQDTERRRELQRQLEETRRHLEELAAELQREFREAEPRWEEAGREWEKMAEEWQREWKEVEPQWEEVSRDWAKATEEWQREWAEAEPRWEEVSRDWAKAAEEWQREWEEVEPRWEEASRDWAKAAEEWQREWEDAYPGSELAVHLGSGGFFAASAAVIGVWLELELDGELEDRGARVTRIVDGGPADRAGVRAGDVIISFNGRDLTQPLDEDTEARLDDDQSIPAQRLVALLEDHPPGEPVAMEVERRGERMSLTVTPREREDVPRWRVQLGTPDIRAFLIPARGHGLDLVELNPGLGAYFGTEEGVLVADVDDESRLGLRPGDVVVAVDGRDVDDGAELRRILGSYEGDEEIEFRIWRDGSETSVTGTLGR